MAACNGSWTHATFSNLGFISTRALAPTPRLRHECTFTLLHLLPHTEIDQASLSLPSTLSYRTTPPPCRRNPNKTASHPSRCRRNAGTALLFTSHSRQDHALLLHYYCSEWIYWRGRPKPDWLMPVSHMPTLSWVNWQRQWSDVPNTWRGSSNH